MAGIMTPEKVRALQEKNDKDILKRELQRLVNMIGEALVMGERRFDVTDLAVPQHLKEKVISEIQRLYRTAGWQVTDTNLNYKRFIEFTEK